MGWRVGWGVGGVGVFGGFFWNCQRSVTGREDFPEVQWQRPCHAPNQDRLHGSPIPQCAPVSVRSDALELQLHDPLEVASSNRCSVMHL